MLIKFDSSHILDFYKHTLLSCVQRMVFETLLYDTRDPPLWTIQKVFVLVFVLIRKARFEGKELIKRGIFFMLLF